MGIKIQFHLAQEVTGEAAKVGHFGCILGGYDEPKLMTIFPPALHKRPAVGLVLERRIGPAPLAVPRNTIPFEVAEVSIDGPPYRRTHLRTASAPLRIEPDNPGLDHHPSCPEAASGISLPSTVLAMPRKRGDDFRASAARVEPAWPSSFPAVSRSRSRTYPAGIATRLADGDLDLFEERLRPRVDACATIA
jgi:hypothetical protein